jgi:transposase
VQHTAWFERPTVLHYRRRRYACPCGKRFAEANPLVDRYQRHSREWNQALGLRLVTGKNFTDTARQFSTSVTTALRRFDELASRTLPHVEQLPRVIAVDEYKGDTSAGKYQLLVADGATGRPVDILPDRKKETLKQYLQQKGGQVEVVVMDMSAPFHQAARRALNRPIIVADRFHVHRHVYWALERVRRRVQHTLSSYHRKRCKRLKHVFTKKAEALTAQQRKIRDHYLKSSGRPMSSKKPFGPGLSGASVGSRPARPARSGMICTPSTGRWKRAVARTWPRLRPPSGAGRPKS